MGWSDRRVQGDRFLCLYLVEDAEWRIEGMPPTHGSEGKECIGPYRDIGDAAPLKRSLPQWKQGEGNTDQSNRTKQNAPGSQPKEGEHSGSYKGTGKYIRQQELTFGPLGIHKVRGSQPKEEAVKAPPGDRSKQHISFRGLHRTALI